MSDFNPVTMFFIVYESMGVWLWVSLGLALVLVGGILVSAVKLRRAGASMKRPVIAALAGGLAVALAATFAVPAWTLADIGALSAAVDYAFAFVFALVPGAIVGAIVFSVAAGRCAAKASVSLKRA
ncbi:MAG: hypothetical protein IT536_02540 [Hyphomicrobiales bacterium]|nr:hypothetical protein [Hyphomicrobiales bacterium]